jgi:primosomal protein N' (replication factor Y)
MNSASLHIQVLLPLAIPKVLTYRVPEEWKENVTFGIRVEVPVGSKKRYAGLVIGMNSDSPNHPTAKSILQPIDESAIITRPQLRLWRWISSYYACTLGEVMQAALPSALKMASQSRVVLTKLVPNDKTILSNDEYLIVEALEEQSELSLKEITQILGQKTVLPLLKQMMEKGYIRMKEEMEDQYKERKEKYLRFRPPYHPEAPELRKAFDACARSEHQTNLLMLLNQESRKKEEVSWSFLSHKAEVNLSVARALEKKGIVEIVERTVSRLPDYGEDISYSDTLSLEQDRVLKEIQSATAQGVSVSLIKGVTGSGKTQVYIECIREALNKDQQVLYLVPEIGLTAQLTDRLKQVFGADLAVYHSKLNAQERVEVWQSILEEKKVILAPRSGILLPFAELGLIIVDEEHDRSFKQYDPAPRYHARSAAIMVSQWTPDCQVILGSATPSFDSFYKARKGVYNYSELNERYGGVALPDIELINVSGTKQRLKMKGNFSPPFIERMEHHLGVGEQIILFHNRRGYVPVIHCTTCGYHAMCRHCDISLTLHKRERKLKCHYCGYKQDLLSRCPDCGSPSLIEKGLGTQRVEDELQDIFPSINIERLDWDTAKGKHAFGKIVRRFDRQRTQILIGTQMVSKGLDFDNVGMVGVVDADQLLFFPDFRTNEVAFQLITQVAGRAGRRNKKGYVAIQSYQPTHPVLQHVQKRDYFGLFEKEMKERKNLHYPPFVRLIHLEIKHKNPNKAHDGAQALYTYYADKLPGILHPPGQAPIPRIANFYLYHMQLKIKGNLTALAQAKDILREGVLRLHKSSGYSTVRVRIDVDPY